VECHGGDLSVTTREERQIHPSLSAQRAPIREAEVPARARIPGSTSPVWSKGDTRVFDGRPHGTHQCAVCGERIHGPMEFGLRLADDAFLYFHGRCHYAWLMEREEPKPNGDFLTISCSCRTVFARWVTPDEAAIDLAGPGPAQLRCGRLKPVC
jgi:hypothetical protein